MELSAWTTSYILWIYTCVKNTTNHHNLREHICTKVFCLVETILEVHIPDFCFEVCPKLKEFFIPNCFNFLFCNFIFVLYSALWRCGGGILNAITKAGHVYLLREEDVYCTNHIWNDPFHFKHRSFIHH